MFDTPNWDGALCDDPFLDPDMWFDPHRAKDAKEICADCPIKALCADYALKNNEFGIWGGLSEEDRRLLKIKSRRRIIH